MATSGLDRSLMVEEQYFAKTEESELDRLRKENFDLKLRLFHLQELAQQPALSGADAATILAAQLEETRNALEACTTERATCIQERDALRGQLARTVEDLVCPIALPCNA